MIFLLAAGLIFLLCYFFSIRVAFHISIEKQMKGFIFIIKADLYFFPAHRLLQYQFKEPDFQLLSIFEKMQENSRRLKERAMNTGLKAFFIRFGLRDYKLMAKTALHYTTVENIHWTTAVGLQDAMHTGIGTGSIWAIKGIIISFISINSRMERLHLEVDPDYNRQIFSSTLNCIIRIRIVHIIFIAVYLIYLIVRGYINEYRSGKAARSSHRRTYENSYAEY